MQTPRLVELRLTAFKSFRGATLRLGSTTILTGRNSSGKSNALDGLEVLARLAGGEDLHAALDGRRREGGAVRGGSVGCAPHGERRFSLGCTVEVGRGRYRYDVEIEVLPELLVVLERLALTKPGVSSEVVLFENRHPPGARRAGVRVDIDPGAIAAPKGDAVTSTVSDDRLALTQLQGRFGGRSDTPLAKGVEAVLAALRGVFHLDPVPSLMRDFVPFRDVELRRDGGNLSAALRRLRSADASAFTRIGTLVREVTDDRAVAIDFATSELDDVMVFLNEQQALRTERTTAREMSDGLLRFLAVATALLTAHQGLDVDVRPDSRRGSHSRGGVLIVIEELENGLHPSQARRVLDLVRERATAGTSVLFTTHSPALLDAAEGPLTDSIVVCHRDRKTGRSLLTPLSELPGYAQALAEGTLGRAVTAGRLVDHGDQAPRDYSEFERLLGMT